MEKQIELLEKRNAELDESRTNVVETYRNTQSAIREKVLNLEKACADIRDINNSILMYMAKKNKGKLIIPKNHLEVTKGWKYEAYAEGDNYIFTVKEDKE